MNLIFKISGIAMVAVILCLFIGKQNKDISILLSMATCCGLILYASQYLLDVLAFINDLYTLGDLNREFVAILLKVAGIGLITEITVLICADSGYSALGKTIQIIGVFTIIWTALPLFSALITLLNDILRLGMPVRSLSRCCNCIR